MQAVEPSIHELPQLNHSEAWEDPVFFDEIETPEIPAALLPRVLADFAQALANATETSESLSVMTVLGVLSTATSKNFKVSPREGWQEPTNIYTFIALPPANHKSYVLNACIKPLIDWEKEQAILLDKDIKRLRSEAKTQEKIIETLRLKAAKEKEPLLQKELIQEVVNLESALIEPPILPLLFANDATPESLAISAYEQGGHFALFSDEGGIIETLAGLYSNGYANIDILLKGIDGGEVRIRRKEKSFNLNPFLTVVLTVQPAIIQTLGTKRAYLGNGTLERFLYVLPKSKLGYRTHDKPPLSTAINESYCAKIKSLLKIRSLEKNNKSMQLLTLSLRANEAWRKFQGATELQLRPEGRLAICQGWGGKISGFALRIAGLLHLAEYDHDHLIISEQTMCNALKIAELLTEHAIAAYGLMGIDQIQHDAKIVLNWIRTHGKLTFTKSELILAMRNKKLGKAECLQKAVNLLIDRNIISSPQKLPTRKPTTVYYVNPRSLNN